VEASASGAFGWVLPVEQHRFLRLLKLQEIPMGKAQGNDPEMVVTLW